MTMPNRRIVSAAVTAALVTAALAGCGETTTHATSTPAPTSTPASTSTPAPTRTHAARRHTTKAKTKRHLVTQIAANNPTGAAAALAMLPVKGRAPKTGYSREQFGDG